MTGDIVCGLGAGGERRGASFSIWGVTIVGNVVEAKMLQFMFQRWRRRLWLLTCPYQNQNAKPDDDE